MSTTGVKYTRLQANAYLDLRGSAANNTLLPEWTKWERVGFVFYDKSTGFVLIASEAEPIWKAVDMVYGSPFASA